MLIRLIAVASAVAVATWGGCSPTLSNTATTTTTSPPGTVPGTDVVLTQGGGCGDAFFWAADEAATVAVAVSVDALERSATEPTVIDFTIPDPAVTVEVQRGVALTEGFCNDVLSNHRLDETAPIVAGAGSIWLAPVAEGIAACGRQGRLQLRGAVTGDGASFGPIDIRTDHIGCYAG